MTLAFQTFNPAELSTADMYKLMIGSIVPRPIAFVSTLSPQGVPNLAPFSFFNGVCSNPPTLAFSLVRRAAENGKNSKKDTLLNIEATGEFVVNVVTETIALPMNQAAAEYSPDVNEFAEVGLTEEPGIVVKVPRVLESPIQFECKLNQVITIGDGSPGSADMVLGTIVYVHVREDVFNDGKIDVHALKPIGRLAGFSYCKVGDVFDIQRPKL